MSFNFISTLNELDRLYESIVEDADETKNEAKDDVAEVPENPDEDIIEIVDEDHVEEQASHLVLKCENCGALSIRAEADVEVDEKTSLANVKESCPFCDEADGYTVIGTFMPYDTVDALDETDASDEVNNNEAAAESAEELPEDDAVIEEGIFNRKKNAKKAAEEPEHEEEQMADNSDEEDDAFTTYSYEDWMHCVEYAHKYWAEDGEQAGKMKLWSKCMEVAACENLYKDIVEYMHGYMTYDGPKGTFDHKSYAKHLEESVRQTEGYAEWDPSPNPGDRLHASDFIGGPGRREPLADGTFREFDREERKNTGRNFAAGAHPPMDELEAIGLDDPNKL